MESNNSNDDETSEQLLYEFDVDYFLSLTEDFEIILYIFNHSKTTIFNDDAILQILDKIIQLSEPEKNRIIALIKFFKFHNFEIQDDLNVIGEVLIDHFEKTPLLLTALASTIVAFEHLLIQPNFIEYLLTTHLSITEEFWTFCLCYRKYELKQGFIILFEIGIIKQPTKFLNNMKYK